MRSRLIPLLLAAVLAVAGLLAVPIAPATASIIPPTPCAGTSIRTVPLTTTGGSTVALLQITWQASTGRNCATVVHMGAAAGVAAPTTVSIARCSETRDIGRCSGATARSTDSGTFRSYAGPVSVYSPNNCVVATGSIVWQGRTLSVGAVDGC